MDGLIGLLHSHGASLAVNGKDGQLRLYYGKGVSDLFRLFSETPEILDGATVADKVVGKGAAALMIMAGVRKAHADVISSHALSLCAKHGLEINYDLSVPYIINRRGDGQCPLEQLCGNSDNLQELYETIRIFVENISKTHATKP